MKILGIDPGLSGAMAIIDTVETGYKSIIMFYDTPTVTVKETRREYNIPAILDFLQNNLCVHCVLEQSFAMPGQGVTSMFSIGKGFGMYLGLLTALKIPFEVVHPKKWQKACGVIGGKKDSKNNQAYLVAYRLFPYIAKDLITQRGRVIDGRVDALLLAEYGRRTVANSTQHF